MHALIEKLLADRPHFHAWPDGKPANWAVAPDVLRFIAEQVSPGMNTLETGAGHTTVAFCIAGTHHVSVTPDEEQAGRIRAYLDGLGIDHDLTFIHRSSDMVLPSGDGVPERLDFVLIDGAHRFPFPIIDWHFTEGRIPVGGMVAVDDFRMPSVRILHDFLHGEDDWELVREFQVTSFFRRARKTENVWDWADQNINKPHLERVMHKYTEGADQKAAPGFVKRWLGRG
jgi:predicted O-methyltransferase YrrM